MTGERLLYLSRAEVAGLLPPLGEQLDIVAGVYRELAAGRVQLPPKPAIHPRPEGFSHAMPAYVAADDAAAVKWVSAYRPNKAKGLPYVHALIVLNDAETGRPEAVLDGVEITNRRTAAASGVCVRAFAPEGWRRAAILGAGVQGRVHAEVLRDLNPEVEIAAWDPHPERVAALPGHVRAAAGARDAVEGAEVVVTVGPIVAEPDPPIHAGWLAERCLLLPVDFDSYVARDAIEACDRVLTDDVPQFEHYRGAGHFGGWPEPDGTVGEALAAVERGELAPSRVACVNLGVGAFDAAFARRVTDLARERGSGTELPY